MWCSLLGRIAGRDPLARLLPAVKAVVPGLAPANRARIVKVFLHGWQIPRRTQMHSCWSSWHWRRRRPWPMIVLSRQTGHRRGRQSSGITPARCCLLASGSAIKRITAGVKAAADRRCQSFDLRAGLHPPGKVSLERKKNTAFWGAECSLKTLAGYFAQSAEVKWVRRFGAITPEKRRWRPEWRREKLPARFSLLRQVSYDTWTDWW